MLPSGHKDVRKTSKGRLFRTRGRPIRASNGRPLDGPNATRYVRPNWTSRDVQFRLALDVIVKPPKVKWTSKGRLKTSQGHVIKDVVTIFWYVFDLNRLYIIIKQ